MMKKLLKKLLNNKKINYNSGTTMVETLVAFVVLMIVLAALYGMVRFSSELRMRAVDTANVRSEFNSEIYKKSGMNNVKKYSYLGVRYPDDKKSMFYLKPSIKQEDGTGKTTTYNFTLDNPAKDIAAFQKNVTLPNVDATAFVSTDSRIASENLATPKVLLFKYNKR